MIFLSDNTNCPNCSGSLEDNKHFLLAYKKLKKMKITQNKCIMGGVQLKKEAS
jgi:hypothetical protein